MPLDWNAQFVPRLRQAKGSAIRELLKLLDDPAIVSFAGGIPDPALFPRAAIRRRRAAHPRRSRAGSGRAPIRAERGLRAAPPLHRADDGGARRRLRQRERPDHRRLAQALDFIGRLFLSPGDTVLVARPDLSRGAAGLQRP